MQKLKRLLPCSSHSSDWSTISNLEFRVLGLGLRVR